MSEGWIAVGPPSVEAAVRDAVYAAGPVISTEYPWKFHQGKAVSFETAQGTKVAIVHQTTYGRFVVRVDDDHDGLVDRLRALPVEDVAQLSRRAEAAESVAEKLAALFALASAQALSARAALPAAEEAVRRALGDESPLVRLSAIRATAILPGTSGLALLDGRDDPENPGLAEWRDHYRSTAE